MNSHAEGKTVLHVFDVDGTLTHADSLLLLLRFLYPSFVKRIKLWLSLLPFAAYTVVIGRPEKVKLALLKKAWKGCPKEEMERQCNMFFHTILKENLRFNALEYIEQLRKTQPQARMVMLSASCREWLWPLANYLQMDLICTELAYDNQRLFTGQFATPNCKGPEKVRRLLKQYPAEQHEFICYADSQSDKPLQTISKQFFYRYF